MWEGALAAAGPRGLPEVGALPKSIRAQRNGSGSRFTGLSPGPERLQPFLCPQEPCANLPRRGSPEPPSSSSRQGGRESGSAGLAPSAPLSSQFRRAQVEL